MVSRPLMRALTRSFDPRPTTICISRSCSHKHAGAKTGLALAIHHPKGGSGFRVHFWHTRRSQQGIFFVGAQCREDPSKNIGDKELVTHSTRSPPPLLDPSKLHYVANGTCCLMVVDWNKEIAMCGGGDLWGDGAPSLVPMKFE